MKPSSSPSVPERSADSEPAQVAGATAPEGKAAQVHEMFSSIARRYDLLNTVLSFGFDKSWRRDATKAAFAGGAARVLDVATGTADLALALKKYRPEAEIIGVDFVEAMLQIGRRKAREQGLTVRLEQGDGLALPYPEGSFDALTIAYGLRNFADLDRGLAEFYRVLRPGGRVVVLEFPPPPKGLFGSLFRVYFLQVLPRLGGLVSGRKSAYTYLPDSVLKFPPPDALATRMMQAGFSGVHYQLQTFGVSALHTGDKPV